MRVLNARGACLLTISLIVSGCEELPELSFLQPKPDSEAEAPAGTISSEAPRTAATEVLEDAEVFGETAEALWDGRPSLGKIWVAYADADPQSVVIRNLANGKSVTGALFRRERFFPGPPFQLSSDAAAALDILAGQPTEISVTALVERKIEGAEEPATEEETVVAVETEVTDPESTGDPEAAAIASAAVAAIATSTPPTSGPNATGTATASATPVAETLPAISEPTVAPDAGPALATTSVRPTTQGPNAPQPVAVVAAAPLAVATLPEAAEAEAPVPAAATPAAPATPAASELSRPFVQAATFGSAENAEAAAAALRADGVIPVITEGESTYRLLVGPARDVGEREFLLGKVRAQGFNDAFFVAN